MGKIWRIWKEKTNYDLAPAVRRRVYVVQYFIALLYAACCWGVISAGLLYTALFSDFISGRRAATGTSRRTGFEPCFLNIVAAPRVQGPFSFIARRRHPCCWGSKSPPTSPSCAQHAQYVYKLTHIIVFRRTTTGAAAQYNNVRLTQYQFRFSPPPHHLTTNCLMLFQNPKKSKKFIESTRLLAQQKSKL